MQSKKDVCKDKLRALIQEHEANHGIPTNARFLYYELKQRGYEYQITFNPTAKTHRRPDQYISEFLLEMRIAGETPWNWITDETRDLDHGPLTADTIEDWVDVALDQARINPWKGKPWAKTGPVEPKPLILTEDRATSGVIKAVMSNEYCVRCTSSNGQCHGFLRTDVAPYLYPGQPVLYLGDYNRAGNDIEANNRHILEDEIGGALKWERVAITPAQIRRWNPPAKWTVDGRDGVGADSWESESLGQARLITIVRQRLDRLMRPVKLADLREREEQEREAIRQLLRRQR